MLPCNQDTSGQDIKIVIIESKLSIMFLGSTPKFLMNTEHLIQTEKENDYRKEFRREDFWGTLDNPRKPGYCVICKLFMCNKFWGNIQGTVSSEIVFIRNFLEVLFVTQNFSWKDDSTISTPLIKCFWIVLLPTIDCHPHNYILLPLQWYVCLTKVF